MNNVRISFIIAVFVVKQFVKTLFNWNSFSVDLFKLREIFACPADDVTKAQWRRAVALDLGH